MVCAPISYRKLIKMTPTRQKRSLLEVLVILIIAFIAWSFVTQQGHETIVIDGCEYLKTYSYGWRGSLAHKGNCTNAFHLK